MQRLPAGGDLGPGIGLGSIAQPRQVCARRRQMEIRLARRAEVLGQAAGDEPTLGSRDDGSGQLGGGGHGSDVAPMPASLGERRAGLGRGRCRHGDLRTITGREHARPTAPCDALRIGDVVAPECVADRDPLHRRRPLTVRHGLELQQDLADQTTGLVVTAAIRRARRRGPAAGSRRADAGSSRGPRDTRPRSRTSARA